MTSLPIIRRTVLPVAGRRDLYQIQLELSTRAPERGPGGGDPIDFPSISCSDQTGTLAQTTTVATGNMSVVTATLASAPTTDNLLVAAVEVQDAATADAPAGWAAAMPMVTDQDGHGFFLLYRTVAVADPAGWTFNMGGAIGHGAWAAVAEFQGPLAFVEADDHETVGDQTTFVSVTCGTVDATGHTRALVVGGGIAGDGHPGTFSPSFSVGTELGSIGSGGIGNLNMMAWAYLAGATGSTTMTWTDTYPSGIAHGTAGIVALFECTDGAGSPPAAGQWVYGEAATPPPDGVETTFSTAWPFADGSLSVWVDDLDQTAAVASYDGEAGSFTLSFAPTSTEIVTASYQGR